MIQHEFYNRQWNGVDLRLRSELVDLFDEAMAMYQRLARSEAIEQLVTDKRSPVWVSDWGFRISDENMVKEPIYLAIMDIAQKRKSARNSRGHRSARSSLPGRSFTVSGRLS